MEIPGKERQRWARREAESEEEWRRSGEEMKKKHLEKARRCVDGRPTRRSLHRATAKVPGDRERSARRGSRAGTHGCAWHPANQARDRFRLYRKNRRADRFKKISGFCRAPIHRETRTEARARVRRFRKLSLECRDVFLARIDVPGESEELSAKDEYRAGKAGGIHRNASLPRQIARDLFQARQYFRGLRRTL